MTRICITSCCSIEIGFATLEKNLEVSGGVDNNVPCPVPVGNKRGKGSPFKEHVFLVVAGKQTSKNR